MVALGRRVHSRTVIRVKRAYEPASGEDGERYLVDRLWPRGISKDQLGIKAWLKDVAPSDDLRRWFGHDPARWSDFQRRYRAQLNADPEAVEPLLEAARRGDVTLVYAARDERHNHALVLKDVLDQRL